MYSLLPLTLSLGYVNVCWLRYKPDIKIDLICEIKAVSGKWHAAGEVFQHTTAAGYHCGAL